MAIRKYSKRKSGEKYISKSKPCLKVKELASKDGADTLYYDTRLLKYIQRVIRLLERNYGYRDIKIIVSRGYSTASHNRAVGGASRSLHVFKGSAIDHKFMGVIGGRRHDISARVVCGLYQIADTPGIEQINDTYVHIDTRYGRKGTWKAKKVGSSYPTVSTFFKAPYRRPVQSYKGKKYSVYGYHFIGNKYRLKIGDKLKWVKVK